MPDGRTTYLLWYSTGSDSSIEPELHNLDNFVCVIDDGANDHIKIDEQERDKLKGQGDELVEVNLATKDDESQPIFISATISVELRQALLALLREFKDVFAWT